MFENVEEKLKVVAKFTVVTGIIAGLLLFIALVASEHGLIGLFVGGMCILNYLIIGWFTYGFAELLESNKKAQGVLQVAHKEDIVKENQLQEQIAAQQARAAEAERLRLAQEAEAERIRLDQEAEAQRARNEAYWLEHAREKEALLAKRAEAVQKLDGMSVLAKGQRDTLSRLIDSIDEELHKNR